LLFVIGFVIRIPPFAALSGAKSALQDLSSFGCHIRSCERRKIPTSEEIIIVIEGEKISSQGHPRKLVRKPVLEVTRDGLRMTTRARRITCSRHLRQFLEVACSARMHACNTKEKGRTIPIIIQLAPNSNPWDIAISFGARYSRDGSWPRSIDASSSLENIKTISDEPGSCCSFVRAPLTQA
jgi:hypothetical protein